MKSQILTSPLANSQQPCPQQEVCDQKASVGFASAPPKCTDLQTGASQRRSERVSWGGTNGGINNGMKRENKAGGCVKARRFHPSRTDASPTKTPKRDGAMGTSSFCSARRPCPFISACKSPCMAVCSLGKGFRDPPKVRSHQCQEHLHAPRRLPLGAPCHPSTSPNQRRGDLGISPVAPGAIPTPGKPCRLPEQ